MTSNGLVRLTLFILQLFQLHEASELVVLGNRLPFSPLPTHLIVS